MRVRVKQRCADSKKSYETACFPLSKCQTDMVPTRFIKTSQTVSDLSIYVRIQIFRFLRFRSDESQFAHLAGHLDGRRLWSSRQLSRHVTLLEHLRDPQCDCFSDILGHSRARFLRGIGCHVLWNDMGNSTSIEQLLLDPAQVTVHLRLWFWAPCVAWWKGGWNFEEERVPEGGSKIQWCFFWISDSKLL